MSNTKIEWCDKVWNPITGCSPISEGCKNCYAKKMTNRLKGRYGYPKDDPFRVTFHPDRLEEPLHWKKPSRIFVCSMGDLFHKDVDGEWLKDIFSTIRACSHHTFLVLTKRPQNINKRYFEYFGSTAYSHVWLGVSCEDQKTADERIPILLQIPAVKRFVSIEPMLGSVHIFRDEFFKPYGAGEKRQIHWVIVGGETGPHARPLHPDWARFLRAQCQTSGVPFFFKSWGEWAEIPHIGANAFKYEKIGKRLKALDDKTLMERVGKKNASHLIDGKEYREFPK